MNFTTILVNSKSTEEPFYMSFIRHYENKVIKKLNKRGYELVKGKYHE